MASQFASPAADSIVTSQMHTFGPIIIVNPNSSHAKPSSRHSTTHPTGKARAIVCVDDLDAVDNLSKAAQKHGTTIECLVEIDCGAGRCGVQWGEPVVRLAKKIAGASGLKFSGLQAYQGAA